MSAVKGRVRRSFRDGNEPVMLQARVDRALRDKANRAADAAGITMAAYLEGLLARDDVDANGCPLWLTPRADGQEELPLKSA